MSRIIRHPRARKDLAEIWQYVANDSEKHADILAEKFKHKFQMLAEHPHMGRVRDELGEGLRSMAFGNYVIFYRTQRNAVEIVRVLHGSRDLDDIFNPEE